MLPINYRTMVMSLIKKAVELGDEELYKELYFYENKKNKKIKPFTFGVYLRNYELKEQMIQLNGDMTITISTPDYNVGIAMYNGMLKLKDYKYKELVFIKERVVLEKEDMITTEEVTLKTLSPIYMKDKDGKAMEPTHPDYVKELNYICNTMVKSYRGYGLQEELTFKPLKMKKTVVKEQLKDFMEICNKEYIYITAYSGVFRLTGNVEDLQLLLQLGLGYRRSMGMGLISKL